MANKAISELPQAQNVNNQDLFVLEQSGIAKKLTAETFITEQGIIDALAEALDGHGGIQSVTLASVSGRIRTYRITFSDGSATTFQVYDGTSIERISRTSSSGLQDTYTIFMSDGTTTFFTVTNGADGTVSEAMLNDALKDKAPAITETTESSAIATFTDGADNMVMHNVVAEINPVQSGSGDPSPSNIRPISGWTGCNVTRAGKNLYDFGNIQITANVQENIDFSEFMNLKAGTYTLSYTLDKTVTATRNRPAYYSPSVSYVYAPSDIKTAGRGSWTFTLASDTTLDFFWWSHTVSEACTISGIQLEVGSTATSYEEYIEPTTISVDWSTEAGTVYGGTIDVATGLLTVDRIIDSITKDSAWYGFSTGTGNASATVQLSDYLNVKFVNELSSRNGAISSTGMEAQNYWVNARQNEVPSDGDMCFAYSSTGQLRFHRTDVASITDLASFKANFPDTQVCYKLATPQTYQLTGQQLMTLLGTNNVWADTGNVSVTYPADTKMFIEKLTQPTEDDMTANQAITSGKFFMVGNNLYLATAAIASGAKIIEGTNATRLSLADALNRL